MKKSIWILLIIGAIAWFLYRDQFGYMDSMYKTDFFVIVGALGFFAAQGEMYRQKLNTPFVVTPTVWDSFTVYPQPVGDYMVFRTGGIRMFGMEGERAMIIPRRELKYNGQTYYTRVRLDKIHKYEVPHEVYDLLKQWNINADEVYYGENVLEREYDDPSLAVHSKIARLEEFRANYQTDVLKEALDTVDRLDSHAEEKIKRYNTKPVTDALKDVINDKVLGYGPSGEDDDKSGFF